MAIKDAEMKIRAPRLIFVRKAHNHPNHPKIKGGNIFLCLRSLGRLQVDDSPLPCCSWLRLDSAKRENSLNI